jgi:uncharacterized protein with FMN-binding domain
MKKSFLSIAIFFIFVIYSAGIRHKNPTLSKPVTLTTSSSSSTPATASKKYTDGTYIGSVDDAYYGNVQVSVSIASGQITAVKFLQYPNTHSTSVYINQQAMPYLQQEAIQAQSPNVQIITGATYTSQAFIQSLTDALAKA